MERNPVGWFEIYVNDMDRAKEFYETVLQATLTELPAPDWNGEMFAFPGNENAPGTSGALVKHEMGLPGPSGALLYFSSADCATEIGRVEAAGGKVLMPKFSIGDFGFCGIVSDTEGNTIGFHSMS